MLAMNRLAVLFISLLSGCATVGEQAQVADVASTASVLAAGGVELNPVYAGMASNPAGLVAMGAVKVGMVQLARSSEDKSDCVNRVAALTAAGYAAAGSNLATFVIGPASPFLLPVLYIPLKRRAYYGSAFESCFKAEGVQVFAISGQEEQAACADWYPVKGAITIEGKKLYQGYCDLGNLPAEVVAAQTQDGVPVIPVDKERIRPFLDEKDRKFIDDGTFYLVRTDSEKWK